MIIYFIRHGETTGDVENRFGGIYNDHLSEKGIEQSRDLANILKDTGIETILSSSLIRAQETSGIIANKLGCKVETVPELQERNQYSFLSGMVKDEAKEKYPNEVGLLKDRLNTIEGAESYEDFSRRISNVFKREISNSRNNIFAIVSHGGPLRVLFRDILKLGELSEIGDCAFVEIEKEGGMLRVHNTHKLNGDFNNIIKVKV